MPHGKTKIGAEFQYSGKRSKPTKTEVTAILYKHHEWEDVIYWDVLRRRVVMRDPPVAGRLDAEDGGVSKRDLAQITHWFDAHGFSVSNEAAESAIAVVAGQPDRQKNVLTDYLDSLAPATCSDTLDTLARDILGADDELSNTLVKKTLVGAARRARHPGARHKGMLVLKGAQHCGKTPFLKILAGEHYHTTGNGDITADWTLYACVGKLLVEVEEMSALKSDNEALKTAISRAEDTPNVKFEPTPRPFPRSFVFVATTNKESFLTDPSGADRYWIVEIPHGATIDLSRLESIRDRVWAEADYLARTTLEGWDELTPDEYAALAERQFRFQKEDPFLDPIADWLDTFDGAFDTRLVWESVPVLSGEKTFTGNMLPRKAPTPAEKARIEDCLQALGCRREANDLRQRIGGRRPRQQWRKPEQAATREGVVQRSKNGPSDGPN